MRKILTYLLAAPFALCVSVVSILAFSIFTVSLTLVVILVPLLTPFALLIMFLRGISRIDMKEVWEEYRRMREEKEKEKAMHEEEAEKERAMHEKEAARRTGKAAAGPG